MKKAIQTKKIRKSNRNKSINTETKEQSIKSDKEQEQKQEKDKGDKKESITWKRGRKSKRINNGLKNVRGLKSKLDSFQETIDDYQPALVYIVETHM